MRESRIRAKVIDIISETPEVKTFRFMPLHGHIDFLPGQFVRLYLKINNENINRAYSISSSPLNHCYIELTIKKVDGGKMSTYFHEHVKINDVFELSNPMGRFVYKEEEGSNIMLLSGGCGIVPMMSILRYCTEKKLKTIISLLASTKAEEDMLFFSSIKELKKNNPYLNVYFTLTRSGNSWNGEKGRIDKKKICKYVNSIFETIFYVCGSMDFSREMVEVLKELGAEKIKRDVWG